jgi:hypothetical protein
MAIYGLLIIADVKCTLSRRVLLSLSDDFIDFSLPLSHATRERIIINNKVIKIKEEKRRERGNSPY